MNFIDWFRFTSQQNGQLLVAFWRKVFTHKKSLLSKNSKYFNEIKLRKENKYNEKMLSIATKLRHYNTVTQPQITCACETVFKTTNTVAIDRVLKMEIRIIRNCINKNYQVDGIWRLASIETVYKEIIPVTRTIKKKTIIVSRTYLKNT